MDCSLRMYECVFVAAASFHVVFVQVTSFCVLLYLALTFDFFLWSVRSSGHAGSTIVFPAAGF